MLDRELDELKFKREKMLLVAGQSGNFMSVLALFSSIFTFHSHPLLRAMYEATGLAKIFGPLTIVLEGLDFTFAAAEYNQSLNRNKGKFANMAVKLAKFILTTVAIGVMLAVMPAILGALIATPVAVPLLFLGVIGTNLVANSVTMIRGRYRMYQLRKEGQEDTATFRANETNYKNARLAVGLGAIYTGAVVGLFLVPAILGVALLATPVGMGITIGVAAVGVIASAIYFGRAIYNNIKFYKAYKQAQTQHLAKLAAEENERIEAAPQAQPQQDVQPLLEAAIPAANDSHTKDYYYRKGRLVNVEKGSVQSQQYLVGEIDEKLQQLNVILAEDAPERKWNPLSFFFQESKRKHKLDALQFIKGYIEGRLLQHEMTQIQQLGDVKQFYVNRNKDTARAAFSSWNRDVGDVEDLFDAVNKYAFGDAEPLFAKPPVVAMGG